jgi:mono/diheme cytochrome c family protein
LRDQIAQRGLAQPLHLGRIFRIVHESAAPGPRPALGRAATSDLVKALAHPNGWWRDTAQRLLVEHADAAAVPALKQLAAGDVGFGALHALWTLRGLDALDAPTLTAALGTAPVGVRAAVVRLADPLLRPAPDEKLLSAILALVSDKDPRMQMQLLLTLLPVADLRAAQASLEIYRAHDTDPMFREAASASVIGRETALLEFVVADKNWASPKPGQRELVSALASGIIAGRTSERVEKLLAVITAPATPPGVSAALLGGIIESQKRVKGPVKLTLEPARLTALAGKSQSAAAALAVFTWPGKPGAPPPTVPPLTADEQRRFAEGRELYATICAACHQPTGFGVDGVAPPLFDSEWVLGSEERLARIVLHGMAGKVTVGKRTYDLQMPPLESLSDVQIAGVLTYIRREWGHEAAGVEVATIARIRRAVKSRAQPWTADDLKKLP